MRKTIGGAGLVRESTFIERHYRYYKKSDKIFYGSGNSLAFPARPSGKGRLQIRYST
jgi:hypothetical protein